MNSLFLEFVMLRFIFDIDKCLRVMNRGLSSIYVYIIFGYWFSLISNNLFIIKLAERTQLRSVIF